MKPDAHKGYLARGVDKNGRTCLLAARAGQNTEAIVIATEERLRAECVRQEFKLKQMIPAKVGAVITSAVKEGVVYVMDAESYNFLVEAVSFCITRYHWKLAKRASVSLDGAWHSYAATTQAHDADAIVKRLAADGCRVEMREPA